MPYPMGVRKGERAERRPLHSEHRLRRAQDINRKQLPLYSAGIAVLKQGIDKFFGVKGFQIVKLLANTNKTDR